MVPHEVFRDCEKKNCRKKLVIYPVMQKKLRYPNFCQTGNGPLRSFSIKGEKILTCYPLFCKKKFSITESLSNREWSSTRLIGKKREKIFRWRIVITTPLLSIFFPYQSFSETHNGSPRKFFALLDQQTRNFR